MTPPGMLRCNPRPERVLAGRSAGPAESSGINQLRILRRPGHHPPPHFPGTVIQRRRITFIPRNPSPFENFALETMDSDKKGELS